MADAASLTLLTLPPDLLLCVLGLCSSNALRRCMATCRALRAEIKGAERLWQELLHGQLHSFPISPAVVHAVGYRRLLDTVEKDGIQVFQFGAGDPAAIEGTSDLYRVPGGFRSVRDVYVGGYFIALRTTTDTLVVIGHLNGHGFVHTFLTQVTDVRAGRNLIAVKRHGVWSVRFELMLSDAVPPNRHLLDVNVRHIEIGWQTALVVDDKGTMTLMSPSDTVTWNAENDFDLFGVGTQVIAANRHGLYTSPMGPDPSWQSIMEFDPEEVPLKLRVWFQSVALKTSKRWIVWLNNEFASPEELPDDVCDVFLGDWHQGYITLSGQLFTWGNHCAGGNGHDADMPRPCEVVPRDHIGPDRSVIGVVMGGWRTAIISVNT